jgi:hypothetical protein
MGRREYFIFPSHEKFPLLIYFEKKFLSGYQNLKESEKVAKRTH